MTWTNSPLVDYTLISPNKYKGRRDSKGAVTKLTYIAIHCVVGQVTVERLGQIFANPNRYASSNYGVGFDGRIGMYVEEKDTSWCTSSCVDTREHIGCDNHGISIEVASDSYDPYAITDKAYKATIKLVADICKRNGIKRITWIPEKNKNLAYVPAEDEVLMTAHRFWASKLCPGQWWIDHFPSLQKAVQTELDIIPWGVEDYVDGLYKYALERKHDAKGYQEWCRKLMSGESTPAQVAWGFFGSPEYRDKKTADGRYIQQLYEALLRREPDKTGMKHRMKDLKEGKGRKYCCEYITSSKEFKKFCKNRGI